jgi:hypothetical protein
MGLSNVFFNTIATERPSVNDEDEVIQSEALDFFVGFQLEGPEFPNCKSYYFDLLKTCIN